MEKKIKTEYLLYLGLLCLGIMLRYLVMSLGHNFDFESYCIVGEISGNFRNVYAETDRYNYAPIFLCIQGLLYRISQINLENWILTYRVLIVSVLTMADLGITAFLAKQYSYVKALIFFLNPISIIITGYHNQFDNISIFFALLTILYFNDEEKLNKKDIKFVVFFSLSLITKHLLFILPIFILFIGRVPIKKRLLYTIVPMLIFLLSFVPFAISSKEATIGIINNVFKYRSYNNAPLLTIIYNKIYFPSSQRIIVYIVMMIITAWIVRKYQFENILMIYLIAMVAFSSAIANQYLAIPMASLCILNVGKWNKIYIALVGLFLFLHGDGLGLYNTIIQSRFPNSICSKVGDLYLYNGYIIASWILLFALIHLWRSYSENS